MHNCGRKEKVELAGFEPATLCLQSRCATSCAIAPCEKKSGSRAAEFSDVGPGGLEPPTSSLSGMRSNHLSYGPAVFVTQVDILHPIINTSNGVSNIGVSHFLPRKARHNGVSAICSTAISNRLTPLGQRKAQNNECRRNPAPGDQPPLHPMQRTPETMSPKVNGNRR